MPKRRTRARWSGLLALTLLTTVLVTSLGTAAGSAEEKKKVEYDKAERSSYEQSDCSTILGPSPQGQNGSGGCFIHQGDKFIVTDARRDDNSVAIHWWIPDGRQGICRDLSGYSDGVFSACNKNLPEGKRLLMRAGLCDQGPDRSCRKLRHYTNWGQVVRVYTYQDGAW